MGGAGSEICNQEFCEYYQKLQFLLKASKRFTQREASEENRSYKTIKWDASGVKELLDSGQEHA